MRWLACLHNGTVAARSSKMTKLRGHGGVLAEKYIRAGRAKVHRPDLEPADRVVLA